MKGMLKPIWAMRKNTGAGGEIAWREFLAAAASYRPQIFRFMLVSVRDDRRAERLTQDCFLKAYRSWPSRRGDSSVRTWLISIAIDLQKDYWKNQRLQFWREMRINSDDLDLTGAWLTSPMSSPEQDVVAREQVGQVWKAVKRMSEPERTVFLLRFVEELELKEIVQTTGLSEPGVKTHLAQALAQVRLELRSGHSVGAIPSSSRSDPSNAIYL